MPRGKSFFKIGYVRLRLRSRGAWQAAYTDPRSGRRVRLTIRATSEADAKRQAKTLSDEVAAGRFQGPRRNDGPTVKEALEKAIEASNGTLETRTTYAQRANLFLRWLGEGRPSVKRWADITTEMLRAYVAHCRRELSLSRDGVRLRLVPIRMASRHWFENDPDCFRDVAKPVKLGTDKINLHELAEKRRRKVLSASDLAVLLDFLQEKHADIYPIACLQGLAGLRILEAIYLREQDVNLGAGVVRITETEHHRPKNTTSFRDMPLCDRAREALRDLIHTLPVGDRSRCVFQRGGRLWTHYAYHPASRKAMTACWRERGLESIREYRPRDLRSTWATGVLSAGAPERSVKRYMGHTTGDVLGAHYQVIDLDQLRRDVVPAIEKWWHESGKTENPALEVQRSQIFTIASP